MIVLLLQHFWIRFLILVFLRRKYKLIGVINPGMCWKKNLWVGATFFIILSVIITNYTAIYINKIIQKKGFKHKNFKVNNELCSGEPTIGPKDQ